MNPQSLHQLQHLFIPRRKEHAQHVVRELPGSQSLLKEVEDEVVRNGGEIGDAVNVDTGSHDSQVEKGRRGRHTEKLEQDHEKKLAEAIAKSCQKLKKKIRLKQIVQLARVVSKEALFEIT